MSPLTISIPSTLRALLTHFRHIASDRLPYHWLERYLLWVLGCDKVFLMSYDDYVLTNHELHKLQTGINQMQAGTPLAYVIGEQDFYGRSFVVNTHTLIPRPDSEILVEVALNAAVGKQHLHILDLGTGTGCIALTLAKQMTDSQVVAVDFCAQALAVAEQNRQRLGVTNCQLLQSDWYHGIQAKFDLIVSNPPYIDAADPHLSALVAEPSTALIADDQGLADIKQIIKGAGDYLAPQGLLAIEHGYMQSAMVQQLFIQAGFVQVSTTKDFGGNDRVTSGVWHGFD